jgi:hypothetical protein
MTPEQREYMAELLTQDDPSTCPRCTREKQQQQAPPAAASEDPPFCEHAVFIPKVRPMLLVFGWVACVMNHGMFDGAGQPTVVKYPPRTPLISAHSP